jgi:hypothetical protein
MKYFALFSLCASLLISACWIRNQDKSTSLRIFDGFIVEDTDQSGKFYLQDIESASLIELKFINEVEDELVMDDFGHVEVIGQYNKHYNFLVVDQILDTRELIVLNPIKKLD